MTPVLPMKLLLEELIFPVDRSTLVYCWFQNRYW